MFLSLMVDASFYMLYLRDGFFFFKKGNESIIYICIFGWIKNKQKGKNNMYNWMRCGSKLHFFFVQWIIYVRIVSFTYFFDWIGLVNNHALAYYTTIHTIYLWICIHQLMRCNAMPPTSIQIRYEQQSTQTPKNAFRRNEYTEMCETKRSRRRRSWRNNSKKIVRRNSYEWYTISMMDKMKKK